MSCHQLGSHGPGTPNPAQPTAACALCWPGLLGLTLWVFMALKLMQGALDWSEFTKADSQNCGGGRGAPGWLELAPSPFRTVLFSACSSSTGRREAWLWPGLSVY